MLQCAHKTVLALQKKRPHLTGMYHNSEHRNHREYQKKFNELSER